MDRPTPAQKERDFERFLGDLLRAGVLIAGIVVFTGGIIYLVKHGTALPDYATFHGVSPELRTIVGILKELTKFHGRIIIQTGLLLLILTPVMRVLFSVYGFARERDWIYIVTTAFVFGVLLFGLLGGHL